MIAAGFVLQAWIGRKFADVGALPCQILLFGAALNALAYTPFGVLQGIGKPGVVAKVHLLELVPYIVILVAALRSWGIAGAAIAWALKVTADYFILLHFAKLNDKGGLRTIFVPFAVLATGFIAGIFAPWTPYAIVWSVVFVLSTLTLGTALSPDVRAGIRVVRGVGFRTSAALFR